MVWIIITSLLVVSPITDSGQDNIIPVKNEVTVSYTESVGYDTQTLFEMIVEAEAHPTWGVEGYLLLAQTVKNQLECGKYGESYLEVLTRSGNYTVYSNGRYKKVDVSDNARKAVQLVLQGSDMMDYGQLYFCTVSHLQRNPSGLHGRSEEVYRYDNVVFVR